jgi:hypothetical protein
MEMGPASSYLSQLASKIDQALLVPWSRILGIFGRIFMKISSLVRESLG